MKNEETAKKLIEFLKSGNIAEATKILEQDWQEISSKGVDVGDGWYELPMNVPFLKGECRSYHKSLLPKEPRCLMVLTEVVDNMWHISVSCNSLLSPIVANRLPNWEEMKSARYKFGPATINMAMMLPPKELYVDVHPTCMHWHQIPVGYCLDTRDYMKKDNGECTFLTPDEMVFIGKLIPDFDTKLKEYRQFRTNKSNLDARNLAQSEIKKNK